MEEFIGSQFEWATDYIANYDESENWLIEPLLPAGGIVNIYGKPKTGKSFAAMGMAIAIASGAPSWLGFPILQHGPVAYLQVDTPRGEWKRRWRRIADAGYDITGIGMMDLMMVPYPYNILLPQHQRWLQLQLDAIKPVVVFIDTLREAHDGDENNSTDMKKVINQIRKAARGAAIVFISHARKDSMWQQQGGADDLMDDSRGSSYVSGRMDTIIKFTGGKGKPPRGSMIYKGRSVEQSKIPVVMDPETQLIQLEGDRAKQDQLVLTALRDMAGESTHAMAQWVVSQLQGSISLSTATRRLNETMKLTQKV